MKKHLCCIRFPLKQCKFGWKKVKYFNCSDNSIYKLLNNKNILFLTPYKNKIDNIYNSGRIYKLRKSINLENINLYTIEAFLTTYPNIKHKNFKETFKYYCDEIDKNFINNKFDIFLCSAGCYGI